jgi:WD40 repeat protein
MPEIIKQQFESYVEFAGFIADMPAFAATDGMVKITAKDDIPLQSHDGLLAACISLNGKELLTSGEDGKVMAINQNGDIRLVSEMPGQWIDKLAAGPQGSIAYASGRNARVVEENGKCHEFTLERSAEGLCFAPKGMRLAIARYNGASLIWATIKNDPVTLDWAGAHTGVSFSPNGKYLVTTMQENALHGWRLDNKATGDGKHMQMTGYPFKVKSTSWSPKGKWLASSGAEAAILWPFFGKDGPMGKSPKELGTRGDTQVTCVSCHPSEDVVAIGYGDGMIMAVRIEDAQEVLLRKPGKGSISTMNWDSKGIRLVYGSEEGEAGVIDVTR